MSDWDARYSGPDWAFGTEPNDFLRDRAGDLPAGPVLCLAEGQGRNAVFLAQRGHAVTAVDQSAVGLARARELAASRGVSIEIVHADLNAYGITPGAWSGIVSIFAHMPSRERAPLHRRVVAGLAPGGVFVLEAYCPAQLTWGTGGPSDPDMLPSVAVLREELAGLTFEIGRELERDVLEGARHRGRSAVVQVVARKPAAP